MTLGAVSGSAKNTEAPMRTSPKAALMNGYARLIGNWDTASIHVPAARPADPKALMTHGSSSRWPMCESLPPAPAGSGSASLTRHLRTSWP